MNKVFADTFYWAAILNPKDQWHRRAVETRKSLGELKVCTSEAVLVEFLNFFSKHGAQARQAAVDAVRTIVADAEVEFIPHEPRLFFDALDFYESRLDKGYSSTDCISMLVMREQGLSQVLSHDKHFEQEGFILLL